MKVAATVLMVQSLARQINRAAAQRASVKLGERGLKQLDNDLAGLQARTRTYMSRFPAFKQPNVSGWTEEDWEDWRTTIEGPLLYWNAEDWRKSSWWGNPLDGPPGHRPDMLEIWVIQNQLFAVEEHQVELVREFWGFAQYRAETFVEEFSEGVSEVWENFAEFAKEAAADAADFVEEKLLPKSTLGRAALAAGIIGAIAVAVYLKKGRA